MNDLPFMRQALRLAKRGLGFTSPNPMVGALLVKRGKIIGRGWHRQAGEPHAEIEALHHARSRGHNPKGATLYVTLEPCCTHGRTPPCTEAIIAAGIKRVVVGATDPNPKHAGRGFAILKATGIQLTTGVLADECAQLNEAFNHWIVHRTPFVTVKAAMTLDGKIATASGESKWITGGRARAFGMKLRQASDAVLVGVNTILADNPRLTVRLDPKPQTQRPQPCRRFVLDSLARTPLNANVVADEHASLTTIVVSPKAPMKRVAALKQRVNVLVAPAHTNIETPGSKLNLRWLLGKLGRENVTSLLVEGGGEVNSSFLMAGLAQRIAFFYAPKILGGRNSKRGVAGDGIKNLADAIQLDAVEWKQLGPDLLMSARVKSSR